MPKQISGFSKLSKADKLSWLTKTYFSNSEIAQKTLEQYWNSDKKLQQLHDDFTENAISNYYLPFSVAPNFVINGKTYALPMVIEESSVVAAASYAAKFWQLRGGFAATVISTTKIGHVHFMFTGNSNALVSFFNSIKPKLVYSTKSLTKSMEQRGGGMISLELVDKTSALTNYYQLEARFETKDAMGANFINSCLEQLATTLDMEFRSSELTQKGRLTIVMSILSNFVPDCLVQAEVSCPVEQLTTEGLEGEVFAEKFIQAIEIAKAEPYRAVTHNKGIMNGIDALVIATGNDFRAIEAGVHAYASKNGTYTSLTHASITDKQFKFWIEIPLALGAIGGLTRLHPMANFSLNLLGTPSAKKLMEITAVAGLAQNFAAIRSLITTGIQKGHMKMHLINILNQLEVNDTEKEALKQLFNNKLVSVSNVKGALTELRQNS